MPRSVLVGPTEEGVLVVVLEADAGEVVIGEAGPVEAEITAPPRTVTEVHPTPTQIHVLEDTLATPTKEGETTTTAEAVLGAVAATGEQAAVAVTGVTIPTAVEEVAMARAAVVTGTVVIGIEEAMVAAVEAMVVEVVEVVVEAMLVVEVMAEAMLEEALAEMEAMVAVMEAAMPEAAAMAVAVAVAGLQVAQPLHTAVGAMAVEAEAQARPNRTNLSEEGEGTGAVPMIRTTPNER